MTTKQTPEEHNREIAEDIIASCVIWADEEDKKRITKIITKALVAKDTYYTQKIEEAKREGAWIGFHASAEGFNGEYVGPRCKEKDIWKELEEALTPNHD